MEGNTSQLTFQVRLYRENAGLLPDKNICRKNYTVTAKRDLFSACYVIIDSDGKRMYLNEEKFLDDFLYSETSISPLCDLTEDFSSYYVLKKAILVKKVYNVPFSIFQFIDFDNRKSTDWMRESL